MNKWEARSAVCWRGESLVMMHTTNEATDDRQQPASSSAAESEAHTRPKPKRIKKKYVKERKIFIYNTVKVEDDDTIKYDYNVLQEV